MADENTPDNPQQDEGWKAELTGEARNTVKSKSQVKDIHKQSNSGFFAELKQNISKSKRIQDKIKNAVAKLQRQIQDTRRKIKKIIEAMTKAKPYRATIIAAKQAQNIIKSLQSIKKIAAGDMGHMKNIQSSKTMSSYKTVTGVQYKEPEKFDVQVKVKDKDKDKDKGKEDDKDKDKDKDKEQKQEPEKQAQANEQAREQSGTEAGAKSGAEGKSTPENAKLKEVARGVSAVSAIEAERGKQSAVNTDKAEKRPEAGLSKQAEKALMKEERRQEKEFKKLGEQKDKGITAERTESDKERTEAEKTKEEKTPEKQNQATEEKRKADEMRHNEISEKIGHLREKLDTLQKKREEKSAAAGAKTDENTVKMSAKEAQNLPSVKAEEAMHKAEMSTELTPAEKGGAINSETLQRMEKSAEKAENGLKQTTLVPDYATDEFKQKAAEQGVPLNKSQQEQKQSNLQKAFALSGRPGTEAEKQQQENSGQNQNEVQNQGEQQGTSNNQPLSIDPEKSRAMSAEKGKNNKSFDLAAYNYMHGGRSAG